MRAYLRLVRLPNVFTALTDIVAGVLIGAVASGHTEGSLPALAVLGLASASLYLAGMALNDFADREEDAKFRPGRPIPSGQVAVGNALFLGAGLLIFGVFLPSVVGKEASLTAQELGFAILLYNFAAKKMPLAGPVLLGLCRFLNVRLGMTWHWRLGFQPEYASWFWVPALAVGVYAAGLTAFSAQEETGKQWRAILLGWLFTGGALLLAGLRSPAPAAWLLLVPLAGVLLYLTLRLKREGSPTAARNLVRTGVLGVCVLDGALILGFTGLANWPYAALCVALIAPSLLVARWLAQKEA